MCGTYDNFQNKNCLGMGFVWIFVFLCGGLMCFFSASVSVSVYVTLCGCFMCVFRVDIVCVCVCVWVHACMRACVRVCIYMFVFNIKKLIATLYTISPCILLH
jgi:uncharacterized membrane protein YesL